MKKSHIWYEIEYVDAKCPYCSRMIESERARWEGDIVYCPYCEKDFELGKRK